MRIAISAKEDDLFAQIDSEFEQANFFIIVNPDNLNYYECILNPNQNSENKSPNSVTRMIRNRRVDAIITGNCRAGSLAYFKSVGIKVFQGFSGSILVNLNKLKNLNSFDLIPENKFHRLSNAKDSTKYWFV